MKHLGVLHEAGLVVARREGRVRWNHLNAVPLRRMYERWVSRYEGAWASGLLSLQEAVEGGEGEKRKYKVQSSKFRGRGVGD